MQEIRCECCQYKMVPRFKNIHKKEHIEIYQCPNCKLYWAPQLQMDDTFHSRLDERNRVEAIVKLRETEFQNVLMCIKKHSCGNKMLEVGCSYGWFMQMAEKAGFDVEGIEPEVEIAQQAYSKGLKVTTGYFPQDVIHGGYNIIVFNNVWEHINHSHEMIAACDDLLSRDGTGNILAITVPLSSGILFQISALLEKVGVTEYMTWLWQLHFHSPHIYFFTKENMNRFFEPRGYRLVEFQEIRSIDSSKMKERFLMDKTERFAGIKEKLFAIAWKILKFLPPDKALFIYERTT